MAERHTQSDNIMRVGPTEPHGAGQRNEKVLIFVHDMTVVMLYMATSMGAAPCAIGPIQRLLHVHSGGSEVAVATETP